MTSLMQPSSTAEASRTTASKVMPEKATVYNDKHSVLGVGISAVDYDTAVARIVDAGRKRQSMIVTALAVHGVMTGALDRQHNYRLNKFDMVCPDGQPVRWALNLLYGLGLKDRVYGPNLMLKVCEECEREGLAVFLFGGTEEMIQRLIQALLAKYPRLQIAGAKASRFRKITELERDALADEINRSGAKVCFVGLGCPRQEIFGYEMRERIQMPQLTIGAAFAFHAGMLSQAPRWMQDRGLEWLYRLVHEPRRLWKRYLFLNPAYLTLLAAQKAGLWRAAMDRGTKPAGDQFYG